MLQFRLSRSGLAQVIYVVETYKVGETFDIGAEAIRTAMTSTQVHDGFFLKRTNSTDDTIDYLVSVTKALKAKYEVRAAIPISISTTNEFYHWTVMPPLWYP